MKQQPPRPIDEPTLPQNMNAERAMLGAVLLDNSTLAVAMEKINSGDLFHDGHRRIFAHMIEMGAAQQPIDLVTLSEHLRLTGELEAVGGAAYLSQLVDGVPRISHVGHYCQIVKDDACRRHMIYCAEAIKLAAFNHEDLAEINQQFTQEADRIRSSAQRGTELRTYTPSELRALVAEPVEPLVYPLAVRGMLSLLDGMAKSSGKTTLGLHAVHSSLHNSIFLGHATKKANILYLTEEFKRTFLLALDRTGLSAETAGLHIVPRNEWSGIAWTVLVERVEQKCVQLNIDWLVIDTFFTICGLHRAEQQNDAGLVDAAVAPLRSIAGSLDIAVQINRHERKSGGSIGESGIGSVALTGAADVVLRLQRLSGCDPNIRELEITGRIDADILTIELTDGRYIVRTDDVRKSAQDQAAAVADAISKDQKISIRQLSKLTHIGRFRVERLAGQGGWSLTESGWERKK